MRVKIFPTEYDPQVAAGPPTKWMQSKGFVWTEEDTARCKQMEQDTPIIEVGDDWKPPVDRWTEIVDHTLEESR